MVIRLSDELFSIVFSSLPLLSNSLLELTLYDLRSDASFGALPITLRHFPHLQELISSYCHLSNSACLWGLRCLKRFTVNSNFHHCDPRSFAKIISHFSGLEELCLNAEQDDFDDDEDFMFDFTAFFLQLLQYLSSQPLHAVTFLDLSCNFFPSSACTVLAAVVPHFQLFSN